MKTKPRRVTATEFKAKCLRILDELGPHGVTVTKRGRPVARVVPVKTHDNSEFHGSMKGKIKIKGDIFSTGIKWHAES